MNTQTLKDRIVLLLINGMSTEAATGFCIQQGQSPDQAGQIVEDARKRITVAADYTRDEQLGKEVMRIEDLYAKSMAAQDIRIAPCREAPRDWQETPTQRSDRAEFEAGNFPMIFCGKICNGGVAFVWGWSTEEGCHAGQCQLRR